jgi:hypothetical protein
MEPSPSLTQKKSARYYNGLSFGINVYLRSHINWDVTISIVQAHINNHDYQVDDLLRFPKYWNNCGTFGLVTFYYLIHRNRSLFLLAVNQETKYVEFLLTLK